MDRRKQTIIGERADMRQLYELQAKLEAEQIYYIAEVEEFCRFFFKPVSKQTTSDHALMNSCINPAVRRFSQLEESKRDEFRKTLVAYRNLYAFMSQIIPFQDTDLEKLYTYIRFLLKELPPRDVGPTCKIDDDVALQYYRLQKISEGSIDLVKGKVIPIDGPTGVGTGIDRSKEIELSQLIEILNERFGTEFKPGDQLFFDSIRADAVSNEELRQAAMVNTMENFGYKFLRNLQDIFLDREKQNEGITARFLNDETFREVVGKILLKQVYEQIRVEESGTASS